VGSGCTFTSKRATARLGLHPDAHYPDGRMKARHRHPIDLWPLLALNFFMADMQSGIGPFVGVFLLANGWTSGLIGTALTIGNVAGMLITTPIGGFIDATNRKRAWIVVPGIAVVAGSAIILLSQDFWAVAISQIATSIAGAAIVPAVTGLTLGLVKQRGFNRQIGRNQGLQSCRQSGRRRRLRLSRLALRLRRGVSAGGAVRRHLHYLRAVDTRGGDRSSRGTRHQRGRP